MSCLSGFLLGERHRYARLAANRFDLNSSLRCCRARCFNLRGAWFLMRDKFDRAIKSFAIVFPLNVLAKEEPGRSRGEDAYNDGN